MRYEIELPEDVGRQLAARAAESGEDVVGLIQSAIVRLVRSEPAAVPIRRRPDPPLKLSEFPAPCDLPRTCVQPIDIERSGKRLPDLLADCP